MNLKIFSKALYSSWGYYAPARTLFDCGEGCATTLGNEVYAPERIFISHGHGDHVLGLPSFIGCRNSGRGDKKKPLSIFHTESDSFTGLKKFILERNSKLSYPLEFIEINPGFKINLDDKTKIEAFKVEHTYNSIGYKIMETRKRLKPGINPSEVKQMKDNGVTDIYEYYEANIFTWLLDSCSFDLSHIAGSSHVIFDATFLKAKDREGDTHASVEECLNWARDCGVKRATLAHISTRYKNEEVIKFVNDGVDLLGYSGKVDVILGGNLYEL